MTSVDIPTCTSIENIQVVFQKDTDLQRLKYYIIQGWPHNKDEVKQDMQKYWPIKHELAMINGIAMKSK